MLDPTIKAAPTRRRPTPRRLRLADVRQGREPPCRRANVLEGKVLQRFGTGSRPPIPAGRDAVAYFLSERQADIFLAYCSAAKAAQREVETLQIIPLPEVLAVDGEFWITVLHGDAAREAGGERFALYIPSPAGEAVLARHRFCRSLRWPIDRTRRRSGQERITEPFENPFGVGRS
jgi:molybdate transport system substrate-binding protein